MSAIETDTALNSKIPCKCFKSPIKLYIYFLSYGFPIYTEISIKSKIFVCAREKNSAIDSDTAWNRGIPWKMFKLLIKTYLFFFCCYIRVAKNCESSSWLNWTRMSYPCWCWWSFYNINLNRTKHKCFNNTIRQKTVYLNSKKYLHFKNTPKPQMSQRGK